MSRLVSPSQYAIICRGNMRELYIVFSICWGKQCLNFFRIPVVIDTLCATLFMSVPFQVVIYLMLKKFKLFTYSI